MFQKMRRRQINAIYTHNPNYCAWHYSDMLTTIHNINFHLHTHTRTFYRRRKKSLQKPKRIENEAVIWEGSESERHTNYIYFFSSE